MLFKIILVSVILGFIYPCSTPKSSIQGRSVSGLKSGLEKTEDKFSHPYIDIDEWRSFPVKHRYMHGGFRGTDTKFSFYFPPSEQYEGRFFQHVTPAPDSEMLAAKSEDGEENKIGFSVSSGGYFVETNSGGSDNSDHLIGAYKANAAVAVFSKKVAGDMYGNHRTFGYLYGGSGGGFRTMGGIENTSGVWDGAVPYVIGSPMALPNVFTVRMHAYRVLGDKLGQIYSSLEPGGNGNMYEGLNQEEKEALEEVTSMGFPPRAWFNYKTLGVGAFAVLFETVRSTDPSYFREFWTQDGYLGNNPTPSLLRDRVQVETKVQKVISAREAITLGLLRDSEVQGGGVDTSWNQVRIHPDDLVAVRISDVPNKNLDYADFIFETSGLVEKLSVTKRIGNHLLLGKTILATSGADVVAKIQIGQSVKIDNSDVLAMQTYHRHQVPSKDFYVWDQFRDEDGNPKFPQRPMLMGPLLARGASGVIQSGKFDGKVIVVETMLDQDAFPWQADWYKNKVRENLGGNIDDSFRLYYIDNAIHGDFSADLDQQYAISYTGAVHQSLRDLSLWVEKGIEPPKGTNYKIKNGQVIVPRTAKHRFGMQPTIKLTANGDSSISVPLGDSVKFHSMIEVPERTGKVVTADWDFEGHGLTCRT